MAGPPRRFACLRLNGPFSASSYTVIRIKPLRRSSAFTRKPCAIISDRSARVWKPTAALNWCAGRSCIPVCSPAPRRLSPCTPRAADASPATVRQALSGALPCATPSLCVTAQMCSLWPRAGPDFKQHLKVWPCLPARHWRAFKNFKRWFRRRGNLRKKSGLYRNYLKHRHGKKCRFDLYRNLRVIN
jgi:hypothetical protein